MLQQNDVSEPSSFPCTSLVNKTEDNCLLEDHMCFLQRLAEARQKGQNVGYGPLHFAASLGNVDLMDHLLTCGCDKDERDLNGSSPLMWVILYDGKEELMDSLVDHGASVNIQNFVGESPLFLAAHRGLYSKALYLLDNGSDVNVVNLEGASPLHASAAHGDTELIALLVKYGAHVNSVDEEGDSPLHWSVREGNVKAACLLVHLGADVHLANEDGESALDLALCTGDTELARDLAFLHQNSQLLAANNTRLISMPELENDDMLDMSSGLQDLWLHDVKKGGKNLSFSSRSENEAASTGDVLPVLAIAF